MEGLADRFRARGAGVRSRGGRRPPGRFEGLDEKVLAAARVPTAPGRTFDELEPALRYLRATPGPWAVKTDGLAAGKGVLVTGSWDEAARDVEAKLSGQAFGDAGRRVLVEEALSGQEISVIAVVRRPAGLPARRAQDYKRVGDGGPGPIPAGWGLFAGAVSPPPRSWARSWNGPFCRPCTPCPNGPLTTAAPCTPGSCSPRTAPRSSSSTSASVTPRLKRCCPAGTAM